MSVQYEVRDSVAVIALDNPPVNGLGHAMRSGIVEAVARANADPAVAAIVLIGAGKLFSGGADIREFNTPKSTAEPTLTSVIRAGRVERQAGDRSDRRNVHGRRPRARARLPLARRHAGRRHRIAGGQARHPAGCRRHAAPATCRRRREALANDRQRCALSPRPIFRQPHVRCHHRRRISWKARSRSSRKAVAEKRPASVCATSM
jgi:3-hydroxyacyl-CoA dehydrogenase